MNGSGLHVVLGRRVGMEAEDGGQP